MSNYGAEAFPKINTGADLLAPPRVSANVASGNNYQDMTSSNVSPLVDLKETFLEMAYDIKSIARNTFETNELIRPTSAEERAKAIKDAETDAPPKPEDDSGPSFLDRLKGLNPFKGGIGTFGKVLLAVAGLLGLKLFGPQIQGGLAGVLQAIADNKLGEKIQEASENLKTKGKELFTQLQEGVKNLLEGISNAVVFVKSIYTAINDYIMSFDTQGTVVYDSATGQTITTGDGKIDEEELGFLKDDIKDKAINIIGNFMGDLLLAFGGLLLGTTFITTAAKALLGNAAIQRIFGIGAPFIGPLPKGAGLSTLLATGGIVSLLAYGITTTFKNFSDSLEETLKENNNEFEIKSFLSNFFGGDDKGGFMNALKQAFLVGGTGALVGMGAKFALLGAAAGPAGIIAGGLLGIAIGGIIGAIAGSYGSEKIKAMMDRFSSMISDTVDKIDLFFTDIVDNIRKFFTGEATAFELDPVRINQAIEDENVKIADLLDRGFAEDSYAVRRRQKKIEEYQNMLDELTPEKIEEARQLKGERLTMGVDGTIEMNKLYLSAAYDNLERLKNLPLDKRSANYDFQIANAIKNIDFRLNNLKNNQLKKQDILSDIGIDYKIPPVVNRIDEILKSSDMKQPNAPGGTPVIQQNTSVDNSTALSSSNVYTHPLAANNPYLTALMANRNKLMIG